jgi:cell division septal protein FtsQ
MQQAKLSLVANPSPLKIAPANILHSWKQIAVFFGRGTRTVQRWEADKHMPVHSVGSGKRRPVFAFPTELRAWLRTVEVQSDRPRAGKERTSFPQIRRSTQLISQSSSLARDLKETIKIQQQKAKIMQKNLMALRTRIAKQTTRLPFAARTTLLSGVMCD